METPPQTEADRRRRRIEWLLMTLVAVLGVSLYVFFYPYPPPTGIPSTVPVQSEFTYDVGPFDYSVAHGVINDIRMKYRLLVHDLAAYGCSKSEARAILETLKTWCRRNHERRSRALTDMRRAKKTLYEAYRASGMGRADDALRASIPTLKEIYHNALNRERWIRKESIRAVARVMSPEARQRWYAVRGNPPCPSRFRYVPWLSAEQAHKLNRANRIYQSGCASARNDREGRAARTEYLRTGRQVLTPEQNEALDQARLNVRRRAKALMEVEAEVLPIPPELVGP